MADDQSRRPPDGRRLVHEERRHAERAVGAAAALPGVRRPRQQPRRLHAQHDRVARDRARLARSGSRNIIYVHHQSSPFPTRIWLPPFAEPIAHARAVPDVARGQHDRHGDRARASKREGRSAPRTWAPASTRGIPGYIDYAPMFKNIPAFWTETAALPVRDAARIHDRRLPARHRDLRPQASTRARGRPGMVAARAMPSTTCSTASLAVLDYAAKYKESLLFNRYMAGRDQIARGTQRRRRSRTSSRRSSAIRSRPSSCCAGSRSAACASRS